MQRLFDASKCSVKMPVWFNIYDVRSICWNVLNWQTMSKRYSGAASNLQNKSINAAKAWNIYIFFLQLYSFLGSFWSSNPTILWKKNWEDWGKNWVKLNILNLCYIDPTQCVRWARYICTAHHIDHTPKNKERKVSIVFIYLLSICLCPIWCMIMMKKAMIYDIFSCMVSQYYRCMYK